MTLSDTLYFCLKGISREIVDQLKKYEKAKRDYMVKAKKRIRALFSIVWLRMNQRHFQISLSKTPALEAETRPDFAEERKTVRAIKLVSHMNNQPRLCYR